MNDRQHQHQKYIEYNLENPSITHVSFSTFEQGIIPFNTWYDVTNRQLSLNRMNASYLTYLDVNCFYVRERERETLKSNIKTFLRKT